MQMFKVVLAAALAVSGVVAKNEWYNCNQCLVRASSGENEMTCFPTLGSLLGRKMRGHIPMLPSSPAPQKCVQNDEIREYASCDDKKDDFCVFMSEQFHEAMDKCFELHCHHECGAIFQIYRNMAEQGLNISASLVGPTDLALDLGIVPVKHAKRGQTDLGDGLRDMVSATGETASTKPYSLTNIEEAKADQVANHGRDVDKQEVDKPEDCGCGHPECDCLSDNPTGKCGCSNKSMAGKMMSQKRQMMPERDLSLHDRRRDIQHAPVCANLCLAKQIQDQFHLYYMDHRLADSICMDRNFIPTCCAKITENDHTQVAKSIIYVKRFCKHKKNNYLTMTDGLDGAQAREQIEDMLAEIEEKKERRKQNDADDE
ncbi:hypothetical protein LIA77_01063 [Sarocladium implicatum]|nr:hypothetical protein LIA77_01063 [Sarocladium implicatum]